MIDRPEYAEAATQLREQLTRWMESTDDPLLAGQVPAPVGSRISRPKGFDSRDVVTVTADTPIE